MKKILFLVPGNSSFKYTVGEAFQNLGYEVKYFDYRKGDLPIRILRFLPKIGGFKKAEQEIERKILKIAKRYQPDIVYVNKGETLTNGLVSKLKKSGSLTINLFPEYLNYWDLAKKISKPYDFFIVFDYPLEKELKKIGRKNVFYLPFGAKIEEPLKTNQVYDVSFVGTYRPSREKYLANFSEFNLNIWGDPRWAKSSLKRFVRGGRISLHEMKMVIRQSRISLNIYFEGYNLNGAPLRIFEVTGTGGFLLSEYRKVLSELFVLEKEIVCGKGINELKQKIRYYLNNPQKRGRVAMAGYKRARKDHCWEKRLKEMFEIIANYPAVSGKS